MDATSGRTAGAGAGTRSAQGVVLLHADEDDAVSDSDLEDLILRGHALNFLPGPLFDDGPAGPVSA